VFVLVIMLFGIWGCLLLLLCSITFGVVLLLLALYNLIFADVCYCVPGTQYLGVSRFDIF